MKNHPDDELVNRLINGLARDTGFARERFRDALSWTTDTEWHAPPPPPPERQNPGYPVRELSLPRWLKFWKLKNKDAGVTW